MEEAATPSGDDPAVACTARADLCYGTFGVVAYDALTDQVQCHVCGAWLRRLAGSHLRRHGLTVLDYRQRYGLGPATSLESPHISALRRQRMVEGYERNRQSLSDDTLHGEIGVLAYDAVADRIQCHGCGCWFHKLTSFHLRKHGLTIPEYKERFGLNDSTPLETPRITELRRRYAEEYEKACFLVPLTKGATVPNVWKGRKHRPQYRKTYLTPEALQAKAERERTWTDAELLADLRALREACGGYLTLHYLRHHRPSGSDERIPSHETVVRRFGSWRRVCELLGQPYHIGRPRTEQPGADRYWSDEEILTRLRELKEECGGVLTTMIIRRHGSGRKGQVSAIPSYRTVYLRFGSWRRVCELLGQPYQPGNQFADR